MAASAKTAKNNSIDWVEEFKPLIKKYKNKPHPLEFQNPYQLVIMVVLAAQDSDRNINKVSIPLFEAYPTFEKLAKADYENILPFLSSVRGGRKKTKWILDIAKAIKTEKSIPRTMYELTKLSGIGRKSASVIMRELGAPAEGIIVDLHVVRVAPRIGVTSETDPKKIEKDLMKAIDPKEWGEVGMAISHLGREICRPTDPKHSECIMNNICAYCRQLAGGAVSKKAVVKKVVKKVVVKKTMVKKKK